MFFKNMMGHHIIIFLRITYLYYGFGSKVPSIQLCDTHSGGRYVLYAIERDQWLVANSGPRGNIAYFLYAHSHAYKPTQPFASRILLFPFPAFTLLSFPLLSLANGIQTE